MHRSAAAFVVMALAGASAASAQSGSQPQLCSERPGLTTDPCVVDGGHFQIETSLADWTRDTTPDERQDTILLGQTLLRAGVGDGLELRLQWTPYGIVNERQDGTTTHDHGIGDVQIGLKQSLLDADAHGGKGWSLALISFATLPAGHTPVGDGTWSAGAQVPVSYAISDAFKLTATPVLEAAADSDGHGRHLLASAALGGQWGVTDKVNLELDVEALNDDDPDPSQRGTQWLAEASASYQPDAKTQLDIGVVPGLNSKAPDVELIAGFTRAF